MSATPPLATARPSRAARRVETRLLAKLDPGETLTAWARGWVSRDGRLAAVVAARTLDYVVLTDHRLSFFTTGFFTRRPRRCVYVSPLDRLSASARRAKRGHRLRLESLDHRPLLLDLRGRAAYGAFVEKFLAATRRPEGDA